MIRIALVGVGKRMTHMNLPILKQFKDRIKIVAATTKSGKLNEETGLKIPVFSSITKMCDSIDVDFVYVSVPHHQTYSVLTELINYRMPTLVDTPISLNLEQTEEIVSNSTEKKLPIGVVEDWPYLPIECFKKTLIEHGILGNIVAVENDYRTYDYHGTAQLRNYLPKGVVPVSMKQESTGYNIEKCVKKDGSVSTNQADIWRMTVAKLNNGALFVNKYSSFYKKVPFRIFNSLRTYGTKGTIIADCLLDSHFKLSILDKDGVSLDLPLQKTYNENGIESLSVQISKKEEVKWTNPYSHMQLDEFQVGIAHHIDNMIKFTEGSGNILYAGTDFRDDLKYFYGKI